MSKYVADTLAFQRLLSNEINSQNFKKKYFRSNLTTRPNKKNNFSPEKVNLADPVTTLPPTTTTGLKSQNVSMQNPIDPGATAVIRNAVRGVLRAQWSGCLQHLTAQQPC